MARMYAPPDPHHVSGRNGLIYGWLLGLFAVAAQEWGGFNDFDEHLVGSTNEEAFHRELGTHFDRVYYLDSVLFHSVEDRLNILERERDMVNDATIGRLEIAQGVIGPPVNGVVARLAEYVYGNPVVR